MQAINSVLAQSYKDFELLVIDDGSTDNTRQTVTAIGDPRI
jgi:glycosyltransferase involved in cell wall biosynthesis